MQMHCLPMILHGLCVLCALLFFPNEVYLQPSPYRDSHDNVISYLFFCFLKCPLTTFALPDTSSS